MHASDIVVHCSLREGLARALPQAMLAGRPVVSFDVDGRPEVVIPGQTGLLVPPKSVAGLASAIQQLVDDPVLARRLGEAGREFARQRFSADMMVDQLDALYRRLTQAKRPHCADEPDGPPD